jgi:hypothetical protein
MSVIGIQIGQCGNQIGEKLFETILEDCFQSTYIETVTSKNQANQKKSSNLKVRSASSSSLLSAKGSNASNFTSNTLEFNELKKSISTLKQINESYIIETIDKFFTFKEFQNEQELKNSQTENPSMYARSILIDMESKVVNKLLFNSKCNFREENSYTLKTGSGNNW